MHIYMFGSMCRGEIDLNSDVDLLFVVDSHNKNIDYNKYSVYSYQRLQRMFDLGNPFAWHLFMESKMIFSDDGSDIIKELGKPDSYDDYENDYERFITLLNDAAIELRNGTDNFCFELSNIFLAMRNMAICYSLCGDEKHYIFSRDASRKIYGAGLKLPSEVFDILERARMLVSRGVGDIINLSEVSKVIHHLDYICSWAKKLKIKSKANK